MNIIELLEEIKKKKKKKKKKSVPYVMGAWGYIRSPAYGVDSQANYLDTGMDGADIGDIGMGDAGGGMASGGDGGGGE